LYFWLASFELDLKSDSPEFSGWRIELKLLVKLNIFLQDKKFGIEAIPLSKTEDVNLIEDYICQSSVFRLFETNES
jgi:hypothetical protein